MIEIKCTQKQKDELIDLIRGEGCNCEILVDMPCDGKCVGCFERNIKWNIQEEPLRPCPFCGGEAKLVRDNLGMIVICKNCGIETQHYLDRGNLIEAWNRRVNK